MSLEGWKGEGGAPSGIWSVWKAEAGVLRSDDHVGVGDEADAGAEAKAVDSRDDRDVTARHR